MVKHILVRNKVIHTNYHEGYKYISGDKKHIYIDAQRRFEEIEYTDFMLDISIYNRKK